MGNETLEKLEEKKLTQQASNRAEKGRKERKGRFLLFSNASKAKRHGEFLATCRMTRQQSRKAKRFAAISNNWLLPQHRGAYG